MLSKSTFAFGLRSANISACLLPLVNVSAQAHAALLWQQGLRSALRKYLPIELQPRAPPRSFDLGGGFKGTQAHLPQQFSFSSDFGHFILKMLENAKFSYD